MHSASCDTASSRSEASSLEIKEPTDFMAYATSMAAPLCSFEPLSLFGKFPKPLDSSLALSVESDHRSRQKLFPCSLQSIEVDCRKVRGYPQPRLMQQGPIPLECPIRHVSKGPKAEPRP